MNSDDSPIEIFVQTWVGELSQAIEMFSGSRPTVSHLPIPVEPKSESELLLWVKQGFIRSGDFSVWIGASEAAWSALGALLGEGDAESYRANYLEILGQAHHGAATVLSSPGSELTCREGEFVEPPQFNGQTLAMFSLEMVGEPYPPLFFAVELAAIPVLDPPEEAPAAAAAPTAPAPAEGKQTEQKAEKGDPPILENLLDLELPMAVGVGSAFVSIKEVVKFSSGSVVALNRDVGETIDLFVHGTLVARGDVVLIKGNYGIRLTEIVSRQERMRLFRG